MSPFSANRMIVWTIKNECSSQEEEFYYLVDCLSDDDWAVRQETNRVIVKLPEHIKNKFEAFKLLM